jgi:hypothetical protein
MGNAHNGGGAYVHAPSSNRLRVKFVVAEGARPATVTRLCANARVQTNLQAFGVHVVCGRACADHHRTKMQAPTALKHTRQIVEAVRKLGRFGLQMACCIAGCV